MDKRQTELKYSERAPLYKEAGQKITDVLMRLLDENEIPYVTISHRVKEFQSFYEKIERKNYKDPFEENEDFCGIRIILFHLDDLKRVKKIIDAEFEIKSMESKSEKLDLNEVGYRSDHYIIKIKESWCVTPDYKRLKNLKIEIQARTVLMHAWAEIEHKLGYKNKDLVPHELKRKLFMLSAMLEVADAQFQEIQSSAENYKNKLIEEASENGKFVSDDFNLNTLQALMDYYFPDSPKVSIKATIDLFEEIKRNNLSIDDVSECSRKLKPYVSHLNEMIFGSGNNRKADQHNLLLYAMQIFNEDKVFANNSKPRQRTIETIRKMYSYK